MVAVYHCGAQGSKAAAFRAIGARVHLQCPRQVRHPIGDSLQPDV